MMAIRIRNKRAFLSTVVAEQRTVETTDGTMYEIVLRDAGHDQDELIIRTPWRGILVEFPIGKHVDVGMEKVN